VLVLVLVLVMAVDKDFVLAFLFFTFLFNRILMPLFFFYNFMEDIIPMKNFSLEFYLCHAC